MWFLNKQLYFHLKLNSLVVFEYLWSLLDIVEKCHGFHDVIIKSKIATSLFIYHYHFLIKSF